MSNKIPVGETIAHAYGFATSRYLRLLGITWAPLAVIAALGLMMQPGFFGNHMPVGDTDEIARQSLRLIPLVLVVSFLVRAMLANGITEEALGLRKGWTFVYFSVAAPVWRFIGAWLLVVLAFMVLVFGMMILFIVASVTIGMLGGAAHLSEMAIGGLVILGLFVFYAAIIFISARLTFFIAPVIVAEKQVDLARGWQLSHGNFWRIVGVAIGIFVPLIFVLCVALFAFFGPAILHEYQDLFFAALHGAKQDVITAQMEGLQVHVRERALGIWPYSTVVSILFETFAYGLMYGAAAFAYKSVNAPPAMLQNTPG